MNRPCSMRSFSDAIRRAGLTPPDAIEPGTLHRIPGKDKGKSNRAGWCKLFGDGLGGAFGDWSTGLAETWHAARDKPLSNAERQAFAAKVEDAKRERSRIRQVEQVAAAVEATKLHDRAGPAMTANPYLMAKCITAPPGVRQADGLLIVPMVDCYSGKLRGSQTIAAEGSKRFTVGMALTGCSFTIEAMQGGGPIAIVEGVATGASVHQATGWKTVCAFTANNLVSVASTVRQLHPAARIVICADNDYATEAAGRGNAGLKAGRAAAKAVLGVLVAPPASGGTDWNDYARLRGIEALRDALMAAAGGVA